MKKDGECFFALYKPFFASGGSGGDASVSLAFCEDAYLLSRDESMRKVGRQG